MHCVGCVSAELDQASPVFFTFHFCSQYYVEVEEWLKQVRPGLIHHVSDIRWMQGGCGKGRGGGNHKNSTLVFRLSALLQKLTFKLNALIFEDRPPLPKSTSPPLM